MSHVLCDAHDVCDARAMCAPPPTVRTHFSKQPVSSPPAFPWCPPEGLGPACLLHTEEQLPRPDGVGAGPAAASQLTVQTPVFVGAWGAVWWHPLNQRIPTGLCVCGCWCLVAPGCGLSCMVLPRPPAEGSPGVRAPALLARGEGTR